VRVASRIIDGEALVTPAGTVRIVSRVDAVAVGRLFASRHRPIAVEVTRNGETVRHAVSDPGFLAAVASYALRMLSMKRRRR